MELHMRIAELWAKSKDRTIDREEYKELSKHLDTFSDMCRKVAQLQNESELAHLTNDIEWQEEIKIKIEKAKGALRI